MPLWPGLEYTKGALSISYRGSEHSQLARVSLKLKEPAWDVSVWNWMSMFQDAANAGMFGGRHFAPEKGRVEALSGPSMSYRGDSFFWMLAVTCVEPLGWRHFIECQVHAELVVRSCVIEGELEVDRTDLSLCTERMLAWLEVPGPYYHQWPSPPFRIDESTLTRGFSVRLKLSRLVDDGVSAEFRGGIMRWQNALARCVSLQGLIPPTIDLGPHYGQTRSELSAVGMRFDVQHTAARAALVNWLTRFHYDVCPIEKAKIGLP